MLATDFIIISRIWCREAMIICWYRGDGILCHVDMIGYN